MTIQAIKTTTCDLCKFNSACHNIGDEECKIPCLRAEDPLYQAFLMGYDKGYTDASEEYEDEFKDMEEWEDEN